MSEGESGFNLDICSWGGLHIWHGQERQPYYVVLYGIIEFNENLMICLVMVSSAWGGGGLATGILEGAFAPLD